MGKTVVEVGSRIFRDGQQPPARNEEPRRGVEEVERERRLELGSGPSWGGVDWPLMVPSPQRGYRPHGHHHCHRHAHGEHHHQR